MSKPRPQVFSSSEIAQYVAERGGVGAIVRGEGLAPGSKEGRALRRRLERALDGTHKTVQLDRGKAPPVKLAEKVKPPAPPRRAPAVRPVSLVAYRVRITFTTGGNGSEADDRVRDRVQVFTENNPLNRRIGGTDFGARLIAVNFPNAPMSVRDGYSVVTYSDGSTRRLDNGAWYNTDETNGVYDDPDARGDADRADDLEPVNYDSDAGEWEDIF